MRQGVVHRIEVLPEEGACEIQKVIIHALDFCWVRGDATFFRCCGHSKPRDWNMPHPKILEALKQ